MKKFQIKPFFVNTILHVWFRSKRDIWKSSVEGVFEIELYIRNLNQYQSYGDRAKEEYPDSSGNNILNQSKILVYVWFSKSKVELDI